MLGRELAAVCREGAAGVPGAEVFALDIEEIDITDRPGVSRVLEGLRPELVINAAAYTDVDGCETNPELAERVNALGPANLAGACWALGCRLVHVSTDYVFDGRKGSPYVPDDPIGPPSEYGRTKADGERRVREILKDHVIVRTSWLFGVHGKNFVKTILRLAGERDELRVVDDQVGCPTYAPDLARALLTLGRGRWRGTYHFCNDGACSWFEFATEIVRLGGGGARVVPMTTAELDRSAARPAYSVLDTETLTRDTGIRPRRWQEALAECVSALQPPTGPPFARCQGPVAGPFGNPHSLTTDGELVPHTGPG